MTNPYKPIMDENGRLISLLEVAVLLGRQTGADSLKLAIKRNIEEMARIAESDPHYVPGQMTGSPT